MPSIKPLKAGFQIAIITFQKRKTQDHFLLSFPFTKVSFHPQRRPPCCQPWIASVNRYTHTQKDGDQQNPTNKLASCCEFPQSWEHVTGVMSRRQQHTRRHLSIEQKYKICSLTWETFEDETSYEVKQQTQLLSFT